MGKMTSEHHNDRIKFTHNNINLKCKWLNAPIKTQVGKLVRVKTHWCAVFRRPISHAKTHIDSK